ncbi:MAG TPA: YkgJ family cysteine cluster protein [Prolixibacteraceae bacterium]|nr:YkgJ family cysteine cluster protein [Prolixibacteraceae bacterium]
MEAVRYKTPDELKTLVKQNKKAFLLLLKNLKTVKPGTLDSHFHALHEEAFNTFDCLDCANCCQNISPIVKESDIDEMARALNSKPALLIDRYLHIDDERDYVFNLAPCPFLRSDRRCSIYGHHPKACREYPHTNRRKMHQILQLTLKNCEICPVVYAIVSKLCQVYNKQIH